MSVGSVLATTYAHLLGSLIIVFLSTQYQLFSDNIFVFLVVVFLTLGLFIYMISIKPGPFKYILFVIVTVLWGQVLRDRFQRADQKGTLDDICVSIFGIFLGMTLISFWAGDRVLGFGPYLAASLIGLIIARVFLLGLLVSDTTNVTQAQQISKGLSFFGVLLFAGYIAYDTRSIVALAKQNIKQDYVNNSMYLFIDILNLFTDLDNIME